MNALHTIRVAYVFLAMVPIVAVALHGGAGPCEHPCKADPQWFPQTSKPTFQKPDPDQDCDFYRPAWQYLLYLIQEETPGSGPRLFALDHPDDLFSGKHVGRFPATKQKTLRLCRALLEPRPAWGSRDQSSRVKGHPGRSEIQPRRVLQRPPERDVLEVHSRQQLQRCLEPQNARRPTKSSPAVPRNSSRPGASWPTATRATGTLRRRPQSPNWPRRTGRS